MAKNGEIFTANLALVKMGKKFSGVLYGWPLMSIKVRKKSALKFSEENVSR